MPHARSRDATVNGKMIHMTNGQEPKLPYLDVPIEDRLNWMSERQQPRMEELPLPMHVGREGTCLPKCTGNAPLDPDLAYKDHLGAYGVVGAACSCIPGREGCPVFLGCQRYQRVIDGAARDAQAA